MNLGKVIFGFFVLLAATLNFGFFIGDMSNPELHSGPELFAALVISLVVTVLKLGDRTQMGAALLAASLVAACSSSWLRPLGLTSPMPVTLLSPRQKCRSLCRCRVVHW